jgi:hypothetical protein
MKREGVLDLFLGRKVLMAVFQYLEENRGNVITKRETQRGRIGHFFFWIGDFSPSPSSHSYF